MDYSGKKAVRPYLGHAPAGGRSLGRLPSCGLLVDDEVDASLDDPEAGAVRLDVGADRLLRAVTRFGEVCHGDERIGVVGYCMGGLLSFLAAANCGVDAAVSYYGVIGEAVAINLKAAQQGLNVKDNYKGLDLNLIGGGGIEIGAISPSASA